AGFGVESRGAHGTPEGQVLKGALARTYPDELECPAEGIPRSRLESSLTSVRPGLLLNAFSQLRLPNPNTRSHKCPPQSVPSCHAAPRSLRSGAHRKRSAQ